MMMRLRVFAVTVCASAAATVVLGARFEQQLGDTFTDLVREPVIGYYTHPTDDAVFRLKERLASGAATLAFNAPYGYLKSVLGALDLPIDSQIFVYSKTSVQSARINPANPRAIYFNDRLAVGYIRGADYLEFAVQDPVQGTVFYTLDQKPSAAPAIERRDFCLSCHYAYATLGVPGMLVRSIVTSPTGLTLPQFGNYVTDHRSPLGERWGGYYVTGTHGAMRHLGNALISRDNPDADRGRAQNVTTLEGSFDVGAYPFPHSDIAALLVFEHQMRMMNLVTRVGWEVRMAATHEAAVARARQLAPELVDYMLFVDEAPLTDPVQGTSDFAARFSSLGPRDRHGRTLRELALGRSGRLMRYPCSYMIYSEAFEAMPVEAKEAAYRRLQQALTGEAADPRYQRLPAADRAAVLEILRDTKKDWSF